MKVYYLTTIFTFGRHKGKTLKQVLKVDFQYIDWCLRNVEDFVIAQSQFGQITEEFGHFSYEAFKAQKNKWGSYNNKNYDGYPEPTTNMMDDIDWEAETFEAITGGELGDWEDFDGSLDDAFTAMGLD